MIEKEKSITKWSEARILLLFQYFLPSCVGIVNVFAFPSRKDNYPAMSGNSSIVRPAGREHIPLYPKGFIAIRIVQLVIAVIILGLDAYVLSEILTTGAELSIFTVLQP